MTPEGLHHYAWILPADQAFSLYDNLEDSSIFEGEQGHWHVDYYCPSTQELGADFLSENPGYSLTFLPPQDWVAHAAVATPPVSVGDFYVHTPHYPPSLEHRFCLCLPATTAFGSGHHATTQGCLELIQELWGKAGWKRALDFGSGSGILAIAMNCLAPGSTMGVDNDGQTLVVAAENAAVNGIPTVFLEGDSLPDQDFDCIVANVYGPILMDLAPQFSRAKHVILSGILQIQGEAVVTAYEGLGWTLEKTILSQEWVSLWLSKGKTEGKMEKNT